jgi:hypothetical protein
MSESSFRETTVSQAMNIYASLVFVVLWAGFASALVLNSAWLTMLWDWVEVLPFATKIIIWVLFLPIMATLWIWESDLPTLTRLLGFGGIVAWTLLALSNFMRAFRQ